MRVNNREYTSDTGYENEALAREAAATRAYAICRDFSVNDGMFPGQRQGQPGVVQGLPVAIGTGRRNRKGSHQYYDTPAPEYQHMYDDSGSRGSSPRSSDSGFETSSRRSSKSSKSSASATYYMCGCGRSTVRSAYERCGFCAHDGGRWC